MGPRLWMGTFAKYKIERREILLAIRVDVYDNIFSFQRNYRWAENAFLLVTGTQFGSPAQMSDES